MKTKRMFGLIGYPLEHSFSPSYFAKKFKNEKIKDADYQIYPLKSLKNLKKQLLKDIVGFNVTSPYKEEVIAHLDELSPVARKIKSVNTVKIVAGKWIGYNTDVYGFEHSLNEFIGRKKIKHSLILGSGGASKAIIYVLKKNNISTKIISRKRGYRSYRYLDKEFIQQHRLIINCTPLGTFPKVSEKPPIPYQFLGSRHLLFDLVYNPQKSLFLKEGEKRGSGIENGLRMLHLQADKSWEIWNNKES